MPRWKDPSQPLSQPSSKQVKQAQERATSQPLLFAFSPPSIVTDGYELREFIPMYRAYTALVSVGAIFCFWPFMAGYHDTALEGSAVRQSVSSPANVVGAPVLTLRYSGSSPSGSRPVRVFAQIVDPATGLVVDNQITPIPLTLDGASHTVKLPLEIIAFTAASGASLQLQLTPTTVAYASGRLGGTVDFSNVSVTVPTATGLTVVSKAG